jgi:general secretion pathway protein K
MGTEPRNDRPRPRPGRPAGARARLAGVRGRLSALRARLRRPVRREAGVALLLVTVTIAMLGATVGDFAYNSRVDLEAAANSRDMLRAEYMARSSMQLGQLLVAVQGGLYKQLPEQMRDAIVVTDFAGFLAQAFGGDKEAREGLGGLVGLDLGSMEGLGGAKGTNMDLEIQSEEGRYSVNCGGGLNVADPNALQARRNLYLLVNSLIRPPRYNRMFNVPDRDGVIVTYEDLPRAIIDWTDVDRQRYEPDGNAGAGEDRYDRGRDRYEAHDHYMDTIEEMALVRGVSEDFWAAFGEMFTIYGTADCKVLASAVTPDSWPMVAAMIAASSPNPAAVFDPNTAVVAQQVAGVLKTGLPVLKTMAKQMKIEKCPVDAKQCPPPIQGAPPPATGDAVDMLSNLICSPLVAQLPQVSQGLTSLLGTSAPPPPVTPMRPIPMCPGRLGQYLREKGTGPASPRRFYRIDARGSVQRNANKSTQVHIRAVWDTDADNQNPLCTNHPRCRKGTWVYWRMD